MHLATIAYRDGQLVACEQDALWTVRLANLETRARYLDLALAELLGNAPEAHRIAARLLAELADVVEQQEAAPPYAARLPRRKVRRPPHHRLAAAALSLGLRLVAFAVVAGTAFLLTTWLSALR